MKKSQKQIIKQAVCRVCNKQFKRECKINSELSYCSWDCYLKVTINRKTIECLNCGAKLVCHFKSDQQYCSKDCSNKGRSFSEQKRIESLKKRLIANCIEKNGCLLWQGCVNDKGYGFIRHNHKSIGTHRAMWFVTNGEWSKKLILHKCDVRNCININHLFEGTAQDNTDDMMKKGRYHQYNLPVGSQKPGTKIDEAQALEIKKLLAKKITAIEIAKRLNTTIHIVYDIKRNRTWKHVQLED